MTDKVTTLSDPNKRNWAISSRQGSRDLYALSLVSTDDIIPGGGSPNASQASGSKKPDGPTEFIFRVNPKNITITEPAAVDIQPTQDGGQFIEHQGSIYKNITIRGTTGLRPNKGVGALSSVIPIVNVANPLAAFEAATRGSGVLKDEKNGLPRGEQSGFEDLIQLRNLFRNYYDVKRDPELASKYILVWQNGYEGDFFVVEPQQFESVQDASSPLTHTYTITLRTIQRVDKALFQRAEDSKLLAKLKGPQRFNERLNEINRSLASTLNTLDRVASRVVGIPEQTIRQLTQLSQNIANFKVIGKDPSTAFSATRASVKSLAEACLAASGIQSIIDLDDPDPPENDLTDDYVAEGKITDGAEAARALQRAARTMGALFGEGLLFSEPTAQKYDRRSESYRRSREAGSAPPTAGSATDVQNLRAPGATRQVTLHGYDNIFSASQRILGDQARWKELVMINDLKPPYIDATGDGRNVLRPGIDRILAPGSSTQSSEVESDVNSAAQDGFVERMGRDLLIKDDGFGRYDLDVSQKGDLRTIEGVDNLGQAIEVKFSTEQGELPTHPTFGIQAPIGSKTVVRSLVAYQLNARASLLSDSRIDKVRRFNFRAEGNTVRVSADLVVAGIDQGVSVGFDARK